MILDGRTDGRIAGGCFGSCREKCGQNAGVYLTVPVFLGPVQREPERGENLAKGVEGGKWKVGGEERKRNRKG